MPMPSLDMVQAVTAPSTDENLTKLQPKHEIEAIVTFDEGVFQFCDT